MFDSISIRFKFPFSVREFSCSDGILSASVHEGVGLVCSHKQFVCQGKTLSLNPSCNLSTYCFTPECRGNALVGIGFDSLVIYQSDAVTH